MAKLSTGWRKSATSSIANNLYLEMPDVIAGLSSAIGKDRVLTGVAIGERYLSDWTGIGKSRPRAGVLPASTFEVSTVLQICNQCGQTVVPQGGLTELAGGAVPGENDICLSLERMRGVERRAPLGR